MITTTGPLPKVPRVEVEDKVVDIYGDRWFKFSGSPYYKNVDQEDDYLTHHDLSDRYGPLTPYRQEGNS